MAVDSSEVSRFAADELHELRPTRVALRSGARVQRVRCVISDGQRFLLVQNNSRRAANRGKWTLPGGRLKSREQPRAALRREIAEELGFRVRSLVSVADWWYGDQYHRVYGCRMEPVDATLRSQELLACAWLDYADVKQLATLGRMRWGFELDAISLFRRLPL
jgi:8-oxo-dGTP pyrophosphatase MutT (NUDIX family)